LPPLVHVRHRNTIWGLGQFRFPDSFTVRLVEGSKEIPVFRKATVETALGLREKQERLCHKRAAPGLAVMCNRAERREIEMCDRGMIAWTVTVGNLPRDFALVQIDG
jgi:hypothetical protein